LEIVNPLQEIFQDLCVWLWCIIRITNFVQKRTVNLYTKKLFIHQISKFLLHHIKSSTKIGYHDWTLSLFIIFGEISAWQVNILKLCSLQLQNTTWINKKNEQTTEKFIKPKKGWSRCIKIEHGNRVNIPKI
jgi:hypothetical protein